MPPVMGAAASSSRVPRHPYAKIIVAAAIPPSSIPLRLDDGALRGQEDGPARLAQGELPDVRAVLRSRRPPAPAVALMITSWSRTHAALGRFLGDRLDVSRVAWAWEEGGDLAAGCRSQPLVRAVPAASAAGLIGRLEAEASAFLFLARRSWCLASSGRSPALDALRSSLEQGRAWHRVALAPGRRLWSGGFADQTGLNLAPS